jgi:transcriptional regulator with GAF, ATPase, and Fis domain
MTALNVQSLQSIILSIAEARSTPDVIQQIVGGIASLPEVALARVWLLERDLDCPICSHRGADPDRALHLVASAGITRDGAQTRIDGPSHKIRVGERKIGAIAESRKPLLVADVRPEMPWVADPDWIAREGIQSFAGHPLICRGELLGVLAVFNRARFAPEEFEWLRAFADHAAVAIWNGRAFDELNRLREQLEMEKEYLVEEVKEALNFGEIIGKSKPLQKVLHQVEFVAPTNATVLILGESGSGKELIARAIHERSPRRTRPFVTVNCGAIPENLFESEFFGHVKGAFTGAMHDRIGRFELANGGDLFLDEVGEIPLPLQAKLLRALQQKQIERVGESRSRDVDVRIIAATNRDLKEAVAVGRFREDLYYRLSVFNIEIPPLRERKDDIPLLAASLVRKIAARLKINPPRLTREQVARLSDYDWPGNVRELENAIERALILSGNSGHLRFELPENIHHAPAKPGPLEGKVLTSQQHRQNEIENIIAALRRTNGKIFGPDGAAALLGMKPTTLASRIKALGIKRQISFGN